MNDFTVPADLVAPVFNPASFGQRGLVHDIFTRLRRDYPLSQVEVPGYDPHWIVTKWDDLREITRQDTIFHGGDRSKTLISQAGEALVKQYTGGQSNIFRSLVQLDPPEHGAYRAVLSQTFMPEQVGRLAGDVGDTTPEVVGGGAGCGPVVHPAASATTPASDADTAYRPSRRVTLRSSPSDPIPDWPPSLPATRLHRAASSTR